MNVLFLSHCVPNPPDKGERIRAYHAARYLAARCNLHVACYARTDEEESYARDVESWCASVCCERFHKWPSLAAAMARFAAGNCLTLSYYSSGRMRRRIAEMTRQARPDASVVYSVAMAPMAPAGVPVVLDMVDVDSEKWFQYSRTRVPGFAYAIEGRRLRIAESGYAKRASRTLLCTAQELALFRSFEASAASESLENGVDLSYFDPARVSPLEAAAGKRVLVFTGVMDYFPNSDGVCWFAKEVFPLLRRGDASLEFWIVGRNPSGAVRALASEPGVQVTGSVPDVRPYLRSAYAVVAPLRIARGIQNKVLEALAMGRRVLASPAVCDTFGEQPPFGVMRCDRAEDYRTALTSAIGEADEIRARAGERFSWERNLEGLWGMVRGAAGGTAPRVSSE